MTEPGNTSAFSTAATDGAGQGIGLIRRLTAINLGLVTIQALSAGFLMSGFDHASTVHAAVAQALLLGAFIQAVTAIVLWRRGRVPAWVAGVSIGLLVIVLLQTGAGHSRRYWLHVPLGVGLVAGLMRQMKRLDTYLGGN